MARPIRSSLSPVVVLPGVVEEVHAGVDRLVDDAHRLGDGRDLAEVVAAEAEDRHLVGVTAEATPRNHRQSLPVNTIASSTMRTRLRPPVGP